MYQAADYSTLQARQVLDQGTLGRENLPPVACGSPTPSGVERSTGCSPDLRVCIPEGRAVTVLGTEALFLPTVPMDNLGPYISHCQ